MRENKGFTLIELLAVIVVLAIIALIAVPIILNVIEKSREGAAKSSILGYVEATEKSYVIEVTKGNGAAQNWPDADSQDENGNDCYTVATLSDVVKVKGKAPSNSTLVCMNKKHIVETITGSIGEYNVLYKNKKVTLSKGAIEEIIYAEQVSFTPAAKNDTNVDPDWASVTNVKEALDYLYGN